MEALLFLYICKSIRVRVFSLNMITLKTNFCNYLTKLYAEIQKLLSFLFLFCSICVWLCLQSCGHSIDFLSFVTSMRAVNQKPHWTFPFPCVSYKQTLSFANSWLQTSLPWKNPTKLWTAKEIMYKSTNILIVRSVNVHESFMHPSLTSDLSSRKVIFQVDRCWARKRIVGR